MFNNRLTHRVLFTEWFPLNDHLIIIIGMMVEPCAQRFVELDVLPVFPVFEFIHGPQSTFRATYPEVQPPERIQLVADVFVKRSSAGRNELELGKPGKVVWIANQVLNQGGRIRAVFYNTETVDLIRDIGCIGFVGRSKDRN